MSFDAKPSDQPHQPMDQLAARLLDTDLTDAERAALLSRVSDNPAELDKYVDQIILHSLLRKEIGGGSSVPLEQPHLPATSICPPLEQPAISFPPEPRGWGGNSWQSIAFFALGMLVAIGGMSWWSWPPQNHQSPVAANSSSMVTPVAYLTSANGCAWGGDSVKTWTVGHIVESGSEIALHEGIAEFRLANGVSLGVEGPASLLVVSPSKLALQYGKLTAHVPWGSEQFNLILPGYRVVTRDGELGVNVTPGKVALHVFSGEAHCSSILAAESKSPPFREVDDELAFEDDPDNQPAIIVGENQAVEIISEPGGRTTRRSPAADPQQFATKVSMSGRLPITEEYVKAVTRSRPVRYWRFEAVENGTIRNQVSNNGALKTTTEVSLSGNENNRVIELGRDAYVSGNLVASLPSSLLKGDSYSVEVWGKPSHYHHGCMVGMFQMNKQVSSLELMRSQTENRPATLRFYQRYDIQQDYKGAECFSSQIYNLRQWQHYVAVKEDDEMRLYINGVQVGKAKANAVALDRGGHLVVGRRFHTIPSGETRGMFVGQLDELAVYDRALSGQEITSHFRAVQFEQPAAVKLNTGQTSEQKSSKFNAF